MVSPGGGPPGNGVGGIFPCWKAAAVVRKDKTLTLKQTTHTFHVQCTVLSMQFCVWKNLFKPVCKECNPTFLHRKRQSLMRCYCPLQHENFGFGCWKDVKSTIFVEVLYVVLQTRFSLTINVSTVDNTWLWHHVGFESLMWITGL